MWLDDFGVYGDEDSGAAEFYMAVEAAAAPMANLVNNLQPTFRRWIERLEVGTDDRPLNGLIHPQGKVLDFNYIIPLPGRDNKDASASGHFVSK